MRFFSWIQGVIVGLSGFIGEVSRNNQFRVTDRDLLTSHVNTIVVDTTLTEGRNYYSTTKLTIGAGATLTVEDLLIITQY